VQRRAVLVNFTDQPVALGDFAADSGHGGWVVDLASDGRGEGRPLGCHLGSNQAVLLR